MGVYILMSSWPWHHVDFWTSWFYGINTHFECYVWLYRSSTSNPVFMMWPYRWALMKMDVWETIVLLSGVTQQCESRWRTSIFSAWAGESQLSWWHLIWTAWEGGECPRSSGATMTTRKQTTSRDQCYFSSCHHSVYFIAIHSCNCSLNLFFKTFSRRQWLKIFTQHSMFFFLGALCKAKVWAIFLGSIKNATKLKGQSSKR